MSSFRVWDALAQSAKPGRRAQCTYAPFVSFGNPARAAPVIGKQTLTTGSEQ